MIPTWARPWTNVFCPGPCPRTSADGLSTRRYSAGSEKRLPSSNATSSRFSARFKRSSTGQCAVPPALIRASGRRQALGRGLVVAQRARLVDEHDRDPVADRVGEPRLLADQLLGFVIVAQRCLGQRADENLQKLRIDFRRPFHAVPPLSAKTLISGGRRCPRSGAASPPSPQLPSAGARVRRDPAPPEAPASRWGRTGRSLQLR